MPSRFTGAAPVRQRLAFWRGVAFTRCSPASSPLDARTDPRAQGRRILLLEAGEFWQGAAEGRAVSGHSERYRAAGGDEILICAILDGESAVRRHGAETPLRPGGMLVHDFTQPIELRSAARVEVDLVLPRAAVRGALGGDPADLGGRALAAPSLGSLLFEDFRLLARIGPSLDHAARAVAFDAVVAVALAALSEMQRNLGPRRGHGDAALFAEAQRFVERNCASPDLMPEGLAAALGCSRAHLYRLFARRGLTVAGYIQDVRLRRGWAALATQGADRPLIGEVAFQCGFEDPVVFSRAFKRRFGLAPRDIREAHRAAVPPGPRPPSETAMLR